MTRSLEGAVAIVTGAGSGLGRAEALVLAAEGASVVVNDVGSGGGVGSAAHVVDEIMAHGGTAIACPGDVSSWTFAQSLVEAALDSFGDLTILVNNAGILRDRMLFSMSEAEWDDVLRVHLKGHFCTSRWATAHWRAKSKASGEPVWGRVVNTASEAFLVGSPGQPNYAAAKAGIVALTLATAQGCAAYGVTANAICPRADTAMTAPVFDGAADEQRELFLPEQVALLVAGLGRRSADAVTGQVFVAYANVIHLLQAPRVEHTFRAGAAAWQATEIADALDAHFSGSPGSPGPAGFAAHDVLQLAAGMWQRPPRPTRATT